MAEYPPAQPPDDPDDDFGETWIRVKALRSPRGIKASLRFRAWLKAGLRQFHLRAEEVTGKPPEATTS